MSEKDRFDWSDEDSFESLADEPIEGFADLDDMDAMGDMDNMVDYGDMPDEMADPEESRAEDSVATDARDVETVSAKKSQQKQAASFAAHQGRGISSGELGFLFTASILVAAAGIGSASLLSVGVNPVNLWQPDQFLAWENYLNLQNNPVNILMLICLGIVTLTLLGSRAIAKAASGANNRARAAEEMLDRVTSLRLEDESSWQDPAFKGHAPAAAFAAETLGAWRLQASRQKHFTGLEGELHRLERALSDNSRQDLTGRFDSPAVGALSDEMIRYFDERDALVRENSELRGKDQADALETLQVLKDARCWHHASEQTLGLQGAAMDRFADRLKDLNKDVAQISGKGEASAALADFMIEFDQISTSQADTPDPTTELTELVDRGSKLAFQIAMEVARLGPRGERLVPMSQSLEDLTTDFRKVTNQFDTDEGPDQAWTDNMAKLTTKLSTLVKVVQESGDDSWQEQMIQFGPAAGQLARNMAEIIQSYTPQADRLTSLGTSFSEFSGAEFAADDLSSANPDNPPAGVLSIAGQMPFAGDDGAQNEGGIHQPADVDPFVVTPPTEVAESPGDPSFTSSVGEAKGDIFGSGMDRSQLPELDLDSSYGTKQNPFGDDQVPTDDPQLPDDEEKVYDLEDFGATSAAVPEETPAADDSEVHDLSEFAAQPVTDEEQVYDLSDFGGVRLDGPQEESDEEVFDLNTFGAVPLN